MKFVASLIIVACYLSIEGCNTQSTSTHEKENVQTEDTVYDSSANSVSESPLQIQNQTILWQVNDSLSLKLRPPKVSGLDTMTVQHVINVINANYDSIHLEYVKTSHDTVYVHIPNAENLTERIGSTGAQMFMASTTFSLTTIKGIDYVNYDFVEGDHAAPGVYDRSYFTDFQ
jgi:hypothetical protein